MFAQALMRKTMSTMTKTSLALLAVVGLGSCESVQPRAACKTQATEYVAQYFEVSRAGTCMDSQVVTAETLHLNHYPVDREKAGSLPKLGIEPAAIADGFDRAAHFNMMATGTEFSVGDFTTERAADVIIPDTRPKPATKDISVPVCAAPKMSESAVMVPATPADPMADPPIEAHEAMNLTYKWSKMQMLVQPNSNAVHFGGRLERTDGDCTITYDVAGIWPVRPCGNGKDAEGHPDPHTGDADDSLCDPLDRRPDSHDEEREMNAELNFVCDKNVKLCVPSRPFPSYATAEEKKAYKRD